jgi:hypothetical protein
MIVVSKLAIITTLLVAAVSLFPAITHGAEPIITTVAGGGSGDGYPAVASTYNRPIRCVCAPDGSIYFSEDGGRRVCKIDGATGILSTYAGNGLAGDGGIGGPAVDANLEDPNSLTLDAAGNLYVTDRGTADQDIGNHRVCRIDAVTSIITVVAGNGSMGSTGDGGPATEATFNWPTGITFDSGGNLYICDQRNHRVRRVDAVSGIITTVAGSVAGFAGDNGPATSARLRNRCTTESNRGLGDRRFGQSLYRRRNKPPSANGIRGHHHHDRWQRFLSLFLTWNCW